MLAECLVALMQHVDSLKNKGFDAQDVDEGREMKG
jgi:hypothetical protein